MRQVVARLALALCLAAAADAAGTLFDISGCSNSAAGVATATVVNGLAAFGTTLHATPASGAYATTETPFIPATLSDSELAALGNKCTHIVGNLSGFGICASCRAGALGASRM